MTHLPDTEPVGVPGGTLIAASHVIVIEFSTIAAANDYWRN